MLELLCAIIPIYITGSVSFLLLLHLWYGGELAILHDVQFLIFENLPHVVVEEISLVNIECWLVWDMCHTLSIRQSATRFITRLW